MENSILDTVRAPLVQEAKRSPNLLTDLAGLEKYIAESYSSRSFIELLQNADDAGSSRMLVKRIKQYIIIANDGRTFTAQDFESLCRSAASKKERQSSIGFRGIGFKSVVGFAKRIHIFSGKLEATFCRELTSKIIPKAGSVPLIRIPHPIDPKTESILSAEVEYIFQKGYKTIFVLSDLVADFVENEFESLAPSSLLFLRNVKEVTLDSTSLVTYIAVRKKINKSTFLVELSIHNLKQNWIVFNNEDISLTVQKEGDRYINIPATEAVVHAFLPTSEETGFSFKVNGNISTDPSRLRVIHDENTLNTILKIADLYVTLLKKCFNPDNIFSKQNLIEVLLPLFDPRMIKFQKQSFHKQFMEAIIQSASGKFKNLYRRPNWLNSSDSEKLTANAKIKIPPRDVGEVEGVDTLLKSFGVPEVSLNMLSSQLKADHLSTQGAAEIVSHITKQTSTKQISPNSIDKDWRIWTVDNTNISLAKIVTNNSQLDTDFVDIVTEKVGISSELPRLVNAVTDSDIAKAIIPSKETTRTTVVEIQEETTAEPIPSKSVSLVKWRSAEQQVFEILNAEQWSAKDVSRQNIGYDIEAQNPAGETICVEVKSLKYKGQHFSLTSNEEATAREKGKSYVLALVIQQKEQLHVMFIENPLKVIQLERQCRQWVWLCSSYDFTPKIYEFHG